jgi:lipid II:glycine glycyltransferase (peptidoglycan interpeptide bridge formation enzyme)
MKAVRIGIDWHPSLSIYASEPYLKLVGSEYGWLGGMDDSGRLRCILPYTVVRKAIFSMVRFRVETIPVGEDLSVEEEKRFLNSAVAYFCSIGADMIIPATTNTIFRTYPDGADAAPYGSFVIDLTQPEETLWNKFHSKHRNVVRNAAKKGVEIRSGIEHLKTAFELVRDTLKRSDLGFVNYAELERLVLGLGEHVKIFIAEHQGVAHGCAVVPFSGYGAYYLYGGSISNPVSGAMNLLQWEAIRMLRNLGVKRYDFVGARINPEKDSKQEGLMKFKERFGGQLARGYMWKCPIRPLKYAIYCRAVRHLRGGDIVDQERHKLAHD